jgi:hypothetical protein
MTHRIWIGPSLLIALIGCHDAALAPNRPLKASLAKGGPPAPQKADFTITDGFSLVGDGKGTYIADVCGVVGGWMTNDITHLAPAEGKIPKAQQAGCAGIAPRKATVTLTVRHLSDNPHVDDSASPAGSGTFNVQNVKFGWGAALATTINASGATPFCGTLGLRFTPVTFPGTSSVTRDDLGGGQWHMYTRPYPDNIGYCANGGVAAYWHVSLDLTLQVR